MASCTGDWKLLCHFCGDTVSKGRLNTEFYKQHLCEVHSVQENCDSLLQWSLGQLGVRLAGDQTSTEQLAAASPSSPGPGPDGGVTGLPTVTGAAAVSVSSQEWNIPGNEPNLSIVDVRSLHGCEIGLPQQLLHMKGITVSRLPVSHVQARPVIPQTDQAAIARWASGAEYSCKLCSQAGKAFMAFDKNRLVNHLSSLHNLTGKFEKMWQIMLHLKLQRPST